MHNDNLNIQDQSKESSLVATLSHETGKMSSMEISELTGRPHKNVIRDIKNLLKQGVSELNFEPTSYQDKFNRQKPCYNLTKKGCLILASGYNAVLREKIIDRWESLETGKATPAYQVPQSFADALMLAAQQQKQIEEQAKTISENVKAIEAKDKQIAELEEQTEYTRTILNSPSTVLVTQIAQDYGFGAKMFNAILRNLKIQRKVGSQWILYAKYLKKGYVQSHTHEFTHKDGRKDVALTTKWTQKGRLFLYTLLKKHGYLPLIEQPAII
jgi:Rha family phage regulatory protein